MGRTNKTDRTQHHLAHFNSLAPCGANRQSDCCCASRSGISTHSPRVGRTAAFAFCNACAIFISTHSPRVGRTRRRIQIHIKCKHFNSLAPCGANRSIDRSITTKWQFQLTRPVWGEPDMVFFWTSSTKISTHSPRVGRTKIFYIRTYTLELFQLTRPVWGEPVSQTNDQRDHSISTHSPRVGRTPPSTPYHAVPHYFNSLAPCGANRTACGSPMQNSQFQLTRPVWGEPSCVFRARSHTRISTHSPRVGRTTALNPIPRRTSLFQLTRPVWGEPSRATRISSARIFQLTRPVWGEPTAVGDN